RSPVLDDTQGVGSGVGAFYAITPFAEAAGENRHQVNVVVDKQNAQALAPSRISRERFRLRWQELQRGCGRWQLHDELTASCARIAGRGAVGLDGPAMQAHNALRQAQADAQSARRASQ